MNQIGRVGVLVCQHEVVRQGLPTRQLAAAADDAEPARREAVSLKLPIARGLAPIHEHQQLGGLRDAQLSPHL